MGVKKLAKKTRTGLGIIRREGIVSFSIKALQKVQQRRTSHVDHKRSITIMVKNDDVILADPRKPFIAKKVVKKKSYTFNWIMSPPGRGSGGHQNLYRFINYLEQAGHTCRIYLYSTQDKRTVKEIEAGIGDSYTTIKASMQWLPKDREMAPADGLFATGWETAYPTYNAPSEAKRFYFVQDFEPYFYPIGTEHTLAENTYRFGFFGVTAGDWLAEKLHRDFGMQTASFNFGAEPELYSYTNPKPRKEIFFYARPVTARRGFEMGILALELFHKKHPEYTINLAGWDVSDYDIPIPYKNLKTLDLKNLSGLYNRCAAALVISLTNMSLLPLELLACGTIPVINDGENNRLVSNNPNIVYTDNNPLALAEALIEVVEDSELTARAEQGAASIDKSGWDVPGKNFVSIVEQEMHRG